MHQADMHIASVKGGPHQSPGHGYPLVTKATMDCCATPTSTVAVGYTDEGVVPHSTAKLVPLSSEARVPIDPSVPCGVGAR